MRVFNTSDDIYNGTSEEYLDPDAEYPSADWSWWLLQIGTPIIILLGLPGNILSLVIMKSRPYRHKSYSHYLSALAVFDSLVLVGKTLRRVDSALGHAGLQTVSGLYGDVACKVHGFAEHVCYLMSSWLVLCMTVERFVAVVFPLKKNLFCRQRNAVTVIVVLFACLSYSQIFRLIVYITANGSCEASAAYRHVYVVLHVYLYQLVLQLLLPTVLILAFNLTILARLRGHRTRLLVRSATHSILTNLAVRRRRRKTTGMLLVISFTYLVTILPLFAVSLTMHVALVTDLDLAVTLFVRLAELRNVLELVSEVNYAANFYIYVLTGAHFRFAIGRIFRTKRRRGSCTMSYPMTTERERERGCRRSGKMTSFACSNRVTMEI